MVAEYIDLLAAWVLYGCARSCSLNLSTETIQTSVTGAQGWRTQEPTQHSFAGSLEGLVNLQEENLLSLPDLRAKQIARQKLKLRFQRTAIDGVTIYTDEGFFYIVNTSDEGPMNQMNSFTVEFVGTGALTQVFTPAEILGNVKRFQYTGTSGETSFTAVTAVDGSPIILIGKTVLGLEVDGLGFSKMITAGTPVDKQFKFVTATGTLTVPVPLDAGIEVFGYYRN